MSAFYGQSLKLVLKTLATYLHIYKILKMNINFFKRLTACFKFVHILTGAVYQLYFFKMLQVSSKFGEEHSRHWVYARPAINIVCHHLCWATSQALLAILGFSDRLWLTNAKQLLELPIWCVKTK